MLEELITTSICKRFEDPHLRAYRRSGREVMLGEKLQ